MNLFKNKIIRATWQLVLAFLVSYVLVSCVEGSTTTVIRTTGGSATSSDGNFTIQVPKGAVTTSTAITIASSGDNAGQIDTLYKVTGSGGADLTFQQPVTIKLKYDSANIPADNIEDNLQIGLLGPFDSWEILTDSTVDKVNKIITATTTHFTGVGTLSITRATAGAAPKLKFPLPLRDQNTAVIISVFDHSLVNADDSIVEAYCEDQIVKAYTGDIGQGIGSSCIDYPKNINACGNHKTTQHDCDYGTGGAQVTYKNGNVPTTLISYDGHPGYDYRTIEVDQIPVDGIAGHIPVLAAADGIAHVISDWKWGTVRIDHENGYSTHYLHLYQAKVTEGQNVRQGELIGIAGDTGVKGRPHLHFEVQLQQNGKRTYVDPYTNNLWYVAPTFTRTLNDTGITASQCYQAGSDVLVDCGSAGAIALNNAQDGMVGRDAYTATNSNTDGKLGFSFSSVPGGCVQDNVTGLMWEAKTTDGGLRDWNNTYTNYSASYNPSNLYGTATDASGFVNAVSASNLCGYSDWRLPTADELQSIVDYGVAYPGPTVDATWFPHTKVNAYWSASPVVGYSDYAWFVNFPDGGVDYHVARDGSFYVRLVRAGQPQAIPHYTVSADGQEVTDNQTNLIWRRCAEGMNWNGITCAGVAGASGTHEEALQSAASQANSTGLAWRLPNVKELSSIADKNLSNPVIDLTAFPATPAKLFWSATPYVGSANLVWAIDFDYGVLVVDPRTNSSVSSYVRLVRDATPQTLPVVSISASPSSIFTGYTTIISWSSTNSTSCTSSGGGGTGTAGSFTTPPLDTTTTYTVTCSGPGGFGSQSTTVEVQGIYPI